MCQNISHIFLSIDFQNNEEREKRVIREYNQRVSNEQSYGNDVVE